MPHTKLKLIKYSYHTIDQFYYMIYTQEIQNNNILRKICVTFIAVLLTIVKKDGNNPNIYQ
jgi:hypothetical protein